MKECIKGEFLTELPYKTQPRVNGEQDASSYPEMILEGEHHLLLIKISSKPVKHRKRCNRLVSDKVRRKSGDGLQICHFLNRKTSRRSKEEIN